MPWPEAVEIDGRHRAGAGRRARARAAHRSSRFEARERDGARSLGDDGKPRARAVGLKVMDFGIAKVLEAVHATNTQSVGTLQYMSPEQIDARTIDARWDLYALGLMFYELIAGAPPFRSASPRELLNMQCTAAPPALPDEVRQMLPRGVDDWCSRCSRKPGNRPGQCQRGGADARAVPLGGGRPVGAIARVGGERAARIQPESSGATSGDTAPSAGSAASAPSPEARRNRPKVVCSLHHLRVLRARHSSLRRRFMWSSGLRLRAR